MHIVMHCPSNFFLLAVATDDDDDEYDQRSNDYTNDSCSGTSVHGCCRKDEEGCIF